MIEEEATVDFVGLSPDGRYAISSNGAWFLDWELEENEPADWDEGARPYLYMFLRAHQPYRCELPKDRQPTDEEITLALIRLGRPKWSEDDFRALLYTLGCAGYGWLRPEGVRRELETMTAPWEAPPASPVLPSTLERSPLPAGAKVGRNDPCPCGSGKRYKKCHGS
jgi:hypothetical protein